MFLLFIILRILLILLIVFAVLILLFLFCPFTYTIKFCSEKLKISGRIGWLANLIGVSVQYQNDLFVSFRILLFQITLYPKKEKGSQSNTYDNTPSDSTIHSSEKHKEKKKNPIKETVSFQKKSSFIPKVKRCIEVFKQVSDFNLWMKLFPTLHHLLYRIAPKKIKGELCFGFKNPEYTGYVCAGISFLPFLFQGNFLIYPDFETERTYLEGYAFVKGRIFGIDLLICIFRIIRLKEIRSLISSIRKET